MKGNDDGLRVGAGKMLGGGVVGLKRWMWGANLGWMAVTGFLGEGSSDGGPRRRVLLSLLSGGDGGVIYFYKSPYFFVRV